MITKTRLTQLLDYCPKTGVFRWAVGRRGCSKGSIAGCLDKCSGYYVIKVDRVKYGAHQLAFIWMQGHSPNEVDHINRVRNDNRWKNLRAATRSQNHANVSIPHKKSASGVRGVAFQPLSGNWFAHIQFNGKRKHLGTFATVSEAAKARRYAEVQLFGSFAPSQAD